MYKYICCPSEHQRLLHCIKRNFSFLLVGDCESECSSICGETLLIHVYIYICIYVYTCMYVCMHACMYVHIYNTYMYVCIYIYMYLYVNIDRHVCICMYMYTLVMTTTGFCTPYPADRPWKLERSRDERGNSQNLLALGWLFQEASFLKPSGRRASASMWKVRRGLHQVSIL